MRLLVCHHTTCKAQGAIAVLTALQNQAPDGWEIDACGCLAHCGDGPNVLNETDEALYCGVTPEAVPRFCRTLTRGQTWRSRPLAQLTANPWVKGLIVVGILGVSGAIAFLAW